LLELSPTICNVAIRFLLYASQDIYSYKCKLLYLLKTDFHPILKKSQTDKLIQEVTLLYNKSKMSCVCKSNTQNHTWGNNRRNSGETPASPNLGGTGRSTPPAACPISLAPSSSPSPEDPPGKALVATAAAGSSPLRGGGDFTGGGGAFCGGFSGVAAGVRGEHGKAALVEVRLPARWTRPCWRQIFGLPVVRA
jgi:hypothetical protein